MKQLNIYSHENTVDVVLFSAIAGRRTYSFTKKWLHWYFTVNAAKFQQISFTEHSRQLLLIPKTHFGYIAIYQQYIKRRVVV